MRNRIPAFVAALSAAALLAPIASAQICDNPTDTFWKNDSLPQAPGGQVTVSVIPGLCENEAAGMAFYLPPGSPPQKVNKVSIGVFSQGGISGNVMLADLEIYDGITWQGGTPILGTKVFDYIDDIGGNLQLSSGGLNQVDISSSNVVVGASTDSFVVAFRSGFNPHGSCSAGFTTNFSTDNAGLFGCNAIPQTNLIDIIGQGWSDASTALVTGFPLCPLFYNGQWLIRACTEDSTQVECQPDLGLGGPGNVELSVCGQPLATGGSATLNMTGAPPGAPTILLGSVFFAPTFVPELFGVLAPIPAQIVLPLNANGAGQIIIPGVPGGGGPAAFFIQAVVTDGAQIQGYAVSNVVQINLLP